MGWPVAFRDPPKHTRIADMKEPGYFLPINQRLWLTHKTPLSHWTAVDLSSRSGLIISSLRLTQVTRSGLFLRTTPHLSLLTKPQNLASPWGVSIQQERKRINSGLLSFNLFSSSLGGLDRASKCNLSPFTESSTPAFQASAKSDSGGVHRSPL